ncbi:hypothetical protein C2S51_029099 [Perilla frutescens var. frutescens]|nr:hypothetical protein C2S51_029099 [Perilla frutescens var. frutescens]
MEQNGEVYRETAKSTGRAAPGTGRAAPGTGRAAPGTARAMKRMTRSMLLTAWPVPLVKPTLASFVIRHGPCRLFLEN